MCQQTNFDRARHNSQGQVVWDRNLASLSLASSAPSANAHRRIAHAEPTRPHRASGLACSDTQGVQSHHPGRCVLLRRSLMSWLTLSSRCHSSFWHLHQWSSGRIHRCHRCDPGSIPG